MNYRFMKKWVKALRSGKYQQGHRALRKNDNFCCLGVACDLYDPNGWRRDSNLDNNSYYGHGNLLPSKVIRAAGMNTDDGFNKVTKKNLVTFNDSGKSFKWIASYIEKNWRNL